MLGCPAGSGPVKGIWLQSIAPLGGHRKAACNLRDRYKPMLSHYLCILRYSPVRIRGRTILASSAKFKGDAWLGDTNRRQLGVELGRIPVGT